MEFPLGDVLKVGAGIWSGFKDRKLQKFQMTHGIRTRVADAKAAGIHPLAALGANIQPVAGQPLLGDATLSGIQDLGNKLGGVGVEAARLANKETESRIRRNEAETAQLLSQSRTIAREARQPPGATTGGHVSEVPPENRVFGERVRRDPRLFGRAQSVQDEFGDVAEQVVGTPSFLWSLLQARQRRFNRMEDKRAAREYAAYRRSGGRAPAWMWLQQRRR